MLFDLNAFSGVNILSTSCALFPLDVKVFANKICFVYRLNVACLILLCCFSAWKIELCYQVSNRVVD